MILVRFFLLCIFFQSCASYLKIEEVGETNLAYPKGDRASKFVYHSIKTRNGSYSEFQRYRHNASLQCAINREFREARGVRNFYRNPTFVERNTKKEFKAIDRELVLKVNEEISVESGWNKFLRVILLGFYPQKLRKKVQLSVIEGDKKVFRTYLSSANLYAPFNVWPFDLSNSIFLIRKENKKYAKELYEILNL